MKIGPVEDDLSAGLIPIGEFARRARLTPRALRLDAGEWASGEPLPSVAQMAGEYKVARGTVARVLAKLADEGLVHVVPRWGTFRA